MRSRVLLSVLVVTCAVATASAARLDLVFSPQWSGRPLEFDTRTLVTAGGQTVSVTRLDFLLSRLALRRAEDGLRIEATNQAVYVGTRDGLLTATIDGLPEGRYDGLLFTVGLPPALNDADPATFPPGHPLHPANGLHWSWLGGYIALAFEGHWADAAGGHGYALHLAGTRHLARVHLPLDLDLRGSRTARVRLDAARLLGPPRRLVLTPELSSTHSRPGDPLAEQLRDNLPAAFEVESVLAATAAGATARPRTALPPGAVPYRFSFPSYFPVPALPPDNPLTEQGVALGARLFADPQLSVNGRQSCASCHQAAAGFIDAGKAVSRGALGVEGRRNSMPLHNLAWKSRFFWDGRVTSLREQVLHPIERTDEMAETRTNVAVKLARDATYPAQFAAAFGSADVTPERIGLALEQFLLTLVGGHSRFDRTLRGKAQFTAEEQRGFALFNEEFDPRSGRRGADCFHCHGGPLFTSHGFVNNGLDASFEKDPGRFNATGREADKGRFVVPTLRNIANTAPYMHDGRFQSLDEVVRHYNEGVKPAANLDPNIAKHPIGGLHLSAEDQRALVAFLKTLSEE